MAQIDARCSYCEEINHVSSDLAGEQVVCSACGWKFSIPLDASPPCSKEEVVHHNVPRPMPAIVTSFKPILREVGVVSVVVGIFVLLIVIAQNSPDDTSNSLGSHSVNNEPEKSTSGYMGQSPDQAAKEVLDQITSTPEGSAAVDRLASKDDQLTEFQRTHGISDQVAEAAIKEWVITHRGNFDWNLEDVKAICLRKKR